MKKRITISMVITLAVLSAGCAKHTYSIHTQDGRTIISDGKPSESDAGLIGYTDANGVQQQINKSEIKEISKIKR